MSLEHIDFNLEHIDFNILKNKILKHIEISEDKDKSNELIEVCQKIQDTPIPNNSNNNTKQHTSVGTSWP